MAFQSLLSYVAGCAASAIALGLIVATKGVLEAGTGKLSLLQSVQVFFAIGLMALLPILLFAVFGFLVLVVLRTVWGRQSLPVYAGVWAFNGVAVSTAMAAFGGHLIGPNAHQPFTIVFLLAVVGAIGGGVAWKTSQFMEAEIDAEK